jgi:hypothetical protein
MRILLALLFSATLVLAGCHKEEPAVTRTTCRVELVSETSPEIAWSMCGHGFSVPNPDEIAGADLVKEGAVITVISQVIDGRVTVLEITG